ncbi:MAG: helix-turn-helix domain-containing protein [Prosthecobacter sp.]|uniref:helix-turn-helix domain-containing protein n=1 Tax=Prosthecobacter sp. TaxID=1965333 RepID=UPI003904222E
MNETRPQPVRQLVEGLEALYPDAEVKLERGGKTSGVWWIDIAATTTHIVVQWTPVLGFSLEAVGDDDPVYGALPAERYKTVELALKRMTQLLADESQAEVGGVALRELRELHGLSQLDLGTKLGTKQAAVSRVERRSDLHLDTLIAIVQALGGTLEIRARFPDCEVPMRFTPAA